MKERTPKKSDKLNKRKYIRYKPDPGVFALIDFEADAGPFRPTFPALVLTESHQGCGLLIVDNKQLSVGSLIRVQVGNLPPMRAEIRWKEKLDSDATKIGLHFLDL